MNLTGKKVLVIGGAGFIGSHVVRELLKTDIGHVLVYDNFSRGKKNFLEYCFQDSRCKLYRNGADIREVDLLDDAMRGCDFVIHLAGMWLLHCAEFPRTAFHVNIEGTFNILEACIRNNIKRLIFSSSGSVYGNAVDQTITEDHPFLNRNFYGATKIAGEAMCRAFYERYGLAYIGLRYMNVYGPHQDRMAAYAGVIPSLLDKIDINEAPVIHGDGRQIYDFIYVEDVARANILALQADVVDRFYNVGSGEGTSIKDLCNLILNLKQSKLTISYKPYELSDIRSSVNNRVCSPISASKDLGFKSQIPLEEGLNRLIEWRRTARK